MCCSLIAILVFQPCHRLNHRHTPDAFRTCLNFAQNEESTVTNTVPASCQIQPDPKGFLSITKEKCDPMTPFKRSLVVPAITDYRCHPMNGVRVGEACNPGPHCQPPNPTDSPVHQVTCVVTNPTSVYRKTPELVDLAADLLILSETSATQAVQAIEGQALRTKGYHSAWGHPVPPQLSSASDDSLRGAAAGVSVHSRYMCRNSHHPDHSDWFYSGRCQTVFVQFPTIEVKVCNMYGFPASTAFAKGRTNSLFEHVIQTSRTTTHATMICGDFNHHPDQLDAMQILRSLGFRTVEELHFDLTGQTLPHTFGTSTKNDVCILSPTLASLVTHVWVDDSKRFAGHNPLVFQLQLPGHEICTTHWQMPTPWINLSPNRDFVADFYQPIYNHNGDANEPLSDTDPLQIWAGRVESAVHSALKKQHALMPDQQPCDGLPRKYRGRCQPRTISKQPLPKSIKPAWTSHYTPQSDQPSMKLRHWTRQIRRIQLLKDSIILMSLILQMKIFSNN